jgi:hypothetical protein
VLGHSDTRVTKLYSHLLPEHLARARDAVSFAPPTMSPPSASAKAAQRWNVERSTVVTETVPETVPGRTKPTR